MESGEWLFRLGTFPSEKKDEFPEGYTLLDETEDRCYAVYISEKQTNIAVEEFNYFFYRISEEEF